MTQNGVTEAATTNQAFEKEERPTASPPGTTFPLTEEQCLRYENLNLRFENLQLRKGALVADGAAIQDAERALSQELLACKRDLGNKLGVDPSKLQVDLKAKVAKTL